MNYEIIAGIESRIAVWESKPDSEDKKVELYRLQEDLRWEIEVAPHLGKDWNEL